VTNQPIVARGWASEGDIERVNEAIRQTITEAGGPNAISFYVCPHHMHADVEQYRRDCDCRKPKPGLLRRAATEHDLDLETSFMIGDRVSDIAAGAAAGCTTVMVLSGRHLDPPIVSSVPLDPAMKADHVCSDLTAAAQWILSR
jgi:D-glycero-D-manno-heptose 1,7-bisphosphate phosphatase